jgi:hypothetical protein
MHNLNPLKIQLNLICHLLALLEAHPVLHVSRIRVNAGHDYQLIPSTSYPYNLFPQRYIFFWHSWNHASWYNYENNQQDAPYRLIYNFKSALHVSGSVFAHHPDYLTVFTVSSSVHPSCCRLVSWMSWNWTEHLTIYIVQFQLIWDTSRQKLGWTLPDTVNTVECFWWWVKTSPETCRADLE